MWTAFFPLINPESLRQRRPNRNLQAGRGCHDVFDLQPEAALCIVNIMRFFYSIITIVACLAPNSGFSATQHELVNNFVPFVSFLTGQDEGIDRNLDDNLLWMQQQGYSHLRFFGIFPNGVHTFPSPTLDTNGYPTDAGLESILATLVDKADAYGIIVNFDGWEVIAEANRDTATLGVGSITEDELAAVVTDALATGITLISEEQFGSSYLEAIQSATSGAGATHETTAGYWWPDPAVADAQLASVFSYYHYDQAEVDSLLSSGTYPPANLGNFYISASSARFYDIPVSIAVGSFGSLAPGNWLNILRFVQMVHGPERISIEESNSDFIIWDSTFNYMDDIGNELSGLPALPAAQRPVANLVLDSAALFSGSFQPVFNAAVVNTPAIVNTFTSLGFSVVATRDTVLGDAEAYFMLVAGGTDPANAAPLPDFVLPVLNGDKPAFLQPVFGIPDANDAPGWDAIAEFFGLPATDTRTLPGSLPPTATFGGSTLRWGGVDLYLTPRMEELPAATIDTSTARVMLAGETGSGRLALVVGKGNKYLVNSNVVHLEASFVFSGLLGGPLHAPATADIVVAPHRVLVLAEYDTQIDLDLPWSGATAIQRYAPLGSPVGGNGLQDLPGRFSAALTRGELVVLEDQAVSPVDGDTGAAGSSTPLVLYQSAPNPANGSTVIGFDLHSPAQVSLTIYDVRGRRVRTLVKAHMEAGHHLQTWDGRNRNGAQVPSGMYFYRLSAAYTGGNTFTGVRKLTIIK